MRESEFQAKLIKSIKEREPDAIVLKNDSGYFQGIPDLTVLLPNGRWALLECKTSKRAHRQPNQEYYIQRVNLRTKGFAAFIYPENMGDVLSQIDILARGSD